MLLDSIKKPYSLTHEQEARHTILRLYAKDLTGRDISRDTMIILTRDYLKKTGNPKYLAFAEYYLGRIYQAQGRNEQALQFYLNAETNAEKTDNDDIKGLIHSGIGQFYYGQLAINDAINSFKSALMYFSFSKENHSRQVAVLNILANCFFLDKKEDSAMMYYSKALQLSGTAQDSATVMQNSGMMFLALNKLDSAKQQLFQALKLNPDSTLHSLIYLNLSKIYERKQSMDSALYFAKLSATLLEKQNDIYSLYTNWKILSRLEEKNGNCYNALYYNKKCLKAYTEIQTKKGIDIQLIETKHELDIFRNKQQSWLVTVLCLCLCLMSVITVLICTLCIRRKNLKSKQIQSEMDERKKRTSNDLAKIRQELTVKNNCIIKVQSEISEKEKIAKLHMDTLIAFRKKLEDSLYDYSIQPKANMDREQIEKFINSLLSVFVTNNTWETVYNTGKSTFDEIRKQYPELTEQEFKIVCIDFWNYSNGMIADITGLKKTTVQKHKSDLRKKLNIKEGGKISSYIRQ
jgi:tetratricopeptide (TPR) repeat protein